MHLKDIWSAFPKVKEKKFMVAKTRRGANNTGKTVYFVPLCCDGRKCDCRTLGFDLRPEHDLSLSYGTIIWAWETKAFYVKKGVADEHIEMRMGGILDTNAPFTDESEHLLMTFRDMILEKPVSDMYIDLYKMYKYKIGMVFPKDLPFSSMSPCICNSGQVFRICCGKPGL
jgi:hypothetical protein